MNNPTPSSPPSSKLSFKSRAKARSVYKRLAAARLQTIPAKKRDGKPAVSK